MPEYSDMAPAQKEAVRAMLALCQSELDRIAYAATLMESREAPHLQTISLALKKVVEFCFSPPVTRPSRSALWRSLSLLGLFAVIGFAVIIGMYAYSAGKSRGEVASEIISNTTNMSAASGPTQAAAWSDLMRDNDLMAGLTNCQKKILLSHDGQRYCMMPVWLDYASPPGAAASPSKPSAP